MHRKTVSAATAARDLFGPLRIALVALAALALAAGFQVNRAHAGGKWVGPLVAGVVIGGAIAHGLNHHYRHHNRYVAKHYKPRRHVRYHAPRIVIAHPPVVYYKPARVYHVHKPVRVYRHHPRVSFGVHIGW